MTTPHSVSVIVPTHDRPVTLRAALESIRTLEGSDLQIEICVGDNGDNPLSRQLADEFGCVYGKTSTDGAAAARNVALRLATGDFIAFLDDDDIFLGGALRAQIRHFDAHPDCRAVFGQVIYADHELEPLAEQWEVEERQDGDCFIQMLSGYFPQLGATVVRRCVLDEIGYQDEALIGDEDWDWQLRIARDYETAIVDQHCVVFRGRERGTADELIAMRVVYTRRVFFRHFRAGWRRWPTLIAVARSYFGCFEYYQNYFLEAAEQHRIRGRLKDARRALRLAFTTLPIRFTRALLTDRAFRSRHFGRRGSDLSASPIEPS